MAKKITTPVSRSSVAKAAAPAKVTTPRLPARPFATARYPEGPAEGDYLRDDREAR